jgi:4-amino-4-deoxy-L-arabinose transferase-like glycosyltransferase
MDKSEVSKSPRKKLASLLKFFLLILFVIGLYSYSLDTVPVHLNQDELEYALNAKQISIDLHDKNGTFLPFYFWHLDFFWNTPIAGYLCAVFLKLLPLSESSIRLPSVFIGISSLVLIMLLVQDMFNNRKLTFISGILISITPVFFIHSRLLLDNLYIVVFVLLWLLFLNKFLKKRKVYLIFLSLLSLGIGFHSYHAAKIYMPVYLIFTVAILIFSFKKKSLRYIAFGFVGFLIPIILFIPWLTKYPDTLLHQVSYISWLDTSVDSQKGIWGVFNFKRLGNISKSYTTYLGPEILFIKGDRSLIHSTNKVGAFLIPMSLLLIIGIYVSAFKEKGWFSKLLIFGFLTYPLAPSVVNDPSRISRGLVVIPFVILLCVYGARELMFSKGIVRKTAFLILIVISGFQFAYFINDYFGDYRNRSYSWFNNDTGAALEYVINISDQKEVNRIYLDEHTPFVDRYFNFYQLKLNKNLNDIWVFYDYKSDDVTQLQEKSLIMLRSDHLNFSKVLEGDVLSRMAVIHEPDGSESFYIYYLEPNF